jgi:kynureninase
MQRLREKSIQLTGYLEFLLINDVPAIKIFTPSDPSRRGCQLSLSCDGDLDKLLDHLKRHGVVCDSRKPNVIRIAPCPLYNTFTDVYDFVSILKSFFVDSER